MIAGWTAPQDTPYRGDVVTYMDKCVLMATLINNQRYTVLVDTSSNEVVCAFNLDQSLIPHQLSMTVGATWMNASSPILTAGAIIVAISNMLRTNKSIIADLQTLKVLLYAYTMYESDLQITLTVKNSDAISMLSNTARISGFTAIKNYVETVGFSAVYSDTSITLERAK